MQKIGVTLEITKRVYREFEISDLEFDSISEASSLEEIIGEEEFMVFRDDVEGDGDYEMDYSITDDDGVTIVDWNEPVYV